MAVRRRRPLLGVAAEAPLLRGLRDAQNRWHPVAIDDPDRELAPGQERLHQGRLAVGGPHVRHARAAARALRRSAWSGYRIERGGDGHTWMRGVLEDGSSAADLFVEAGGTDAMIELRLAAEDATRLYQELIDLLRRFAELDRADEGPANRVLSFASMPLEAE